MDSEAICFKDSSSNQVTEDSILLYKYNGKMFNIFLTLDLFNNVRKRIVINSVVLLLLN